MQCNTKHLFWLGKHLLQWYVLGCLEDIVKIGLRLPKKANLVLPGLEPGTFRVLSERDNHYTTEPVKM